MRAVFPFLMSACLCGAAPIHKGTPLAWLRKQINPRTKLVASYADRPTCWLYTQALAVIAFAESGGADAKRARDILSFLREHREQGERGGSFWRFAYQKDGSSGGTYTTTGANAWVAMGIAYYEAKTGDRQFRAMGLENLEWMRRHCLKPFGDERGVVMADKNYPQSRHDDTTIFAVEHNLDAYSAFRSLGILSARKEYLAIAADLRQFLTGALHDGKRFRGGARLPDKLNHAFYLDAQSWGVLALGAEYKGCLALAEEKCRVEGKSHTLNGRQVDGLVGFTEWAKSTHLWPEGTEGMVAAYYLVGDREKGDTYHAQTRRFAEALDADPTDNTLGVPYATADTKGLATCESVAGTAWFYLNERRANPFQPPLRKAVR